MPITILHIESSPLGDRSVTRKLAQKLLLELKLKHPDATVITRDFAVKPLPHLDGVTLSAFFTKPEERNAAQKEAILLSDKTVAELKAADIVVIGAPMWNFGIPSSLKAWIDHVVRAGQTFRYTATGPEPLLFGKEAFILSARGGIYSEGPFKVMDHQETYLKAVLGFIGITDITFIRAEGVAMGEEAVKKALISAKAQLAEAMKEVA